MDDNDIYDKKFKEMQKYIPFLNEVISKIESASKEGNDSIRGIQLSKIKSLKSLLTVTEKRMKIENLIRCEEILKKLEIKIGKSSKYIEECNILKQSKTPVESGNIDFSSSSNINAFNFYKEYSPEDNNKKQELKSDSSSEQNKFEMSRSQSKSNVSDVDNALQKQTTIETNKEARIKDSDKITDPKINHQKNSVLDSKLNHKNEKNKEKTISKPRNKILCTPEKKLQESSSKKQSRGSNSSKEKVDKNKSEKRHSSMERHSSKSNDIPEPCKSPEKKNRREKKNKKSDTSLNLLLKYRKLLKKELKMEPNQSEIPTTLNNILPNESCSSLASQVSNVEAEKTTVEDLKNIVESEKTSDSSANINIKEGGKSDIPSNHDLFGKDLQRELDDKNVSSPNTNLNLLIKETIPKNKSTSEFESDVSNASKSNNSNYTEETDLTKSLINSEKSSSNSLTDTAKQSNIKNYHSFEQDVLKALKEEIDNDMPTILKNIPIQMEPPAKKINNTDLSTKTRRISFEKYKEKLNSPSFNKTNDELKVDDYATKYKNKMELFSKVLTPKEIKRFGPVLKETVAEDVKNSEPSNSPKDEELFPETTDEKQSESMYPESPDSTSSFHFLNEDSSFTSDFKLDDGKPPKKETCNSMYSNVRLSPLPCSSQNSNEPHLKPKSIYSTSPLANEEYFSSPNSFQNVSNETRLQESTKVQECDIPLISTNPMTNMELSFNSKDQKSNSKLKYPPLTSRFNVNFPVSANYKGKNPKPLLGFNYQTHSVDNSLNISETLNAFVPIGFNSIRNSDPIHDSSFKYPKELNLAGPSEADLQMEHNNPTYPKCTLLPSLKLNMNVTQSLDRQGLNPRISHPLRDNTHILIKSESSKELSLHKSAKSSKLMPLLPSNNDFNNMGTNTIQQKELFLPSNVKVPLLPDPPMPLLDYSNNLYNSNQYQFNNTIIPPVNIFGTVPDLQERSKIPGSHHPSTNVSKLHNMERNDPRIRRTLHTNSPIGIQQHNSNISRKDRKKLKRQASKLMKMNKAKQEENVKNHVANINRNFKIPKIGNQLLQSQSAQKLDTMDTRKNDEALKIGKESFPKKIEKLEKLDDNNSTIRLDTKKLVILDESDKFVIYDEMVSENSSEVVFNKKDSKNEDTKLDMDNISAKIKKDQTTIKTTDIPVDNSYNIADAVLQSVPFNSNTDVKVENIFDDDISINNDSELYISFTNDNDVPKLLEQLNTKKCLDKESNQVIENVIKVETDMDKKPQNLVIKSDKEVSEPTTDVYNSLVDVLADKKKILNVIALLNEKGDNLPSKIKKKLKLLADLESDEESDNEDNISNSDVSLQLESQMPNPKIGDELPQESVKEVDNKDNKVSKRKSRSRNEVDLLREALPEMFINKGGLDTTGIRMCRLLKVFNDDVQEDTNSKRVTRKSDAKKVVSPKISAEEKIFEDDNSLKKLNYQKSEIPKKQLKINIEKLETLLDNDGVKTSEDFNSSDLDIKLDLYHIKPCPKSKKAILLNKTIDKMGLKQQLSQKKLAETKRTPSPRKKKIQSINYLSQTINNEETVIETKPDVVNLETKIDNSIHNSNDEDPHTTHDHLKLKKGVKVQKKEEKSSKSKVIKKPVFKGKKFKSHVKHIANTTKPYNYRNYYFSKDTTYYCKYCSEYCGNEITKHYIHAHPHREILISRLSPKEAKIAISESLATSKQGFQLDDYASSNTSDYQCRFCEKIFEDCHISVFYEHIIHWHTGEYQHECSICSTYEFEGKSICTKKQTFSNVDPNVFVLKGFLCEKCNYTQIFKKNLDQHVTAEHSNTKCEIFEINLSKMGLSFKNRELELIDVVSTISIINNSLSTICNKDNENNSILGIKKEIIDDDNIYTDTAFNFDADLNMHIKNEEMVDIFSLSQEIANYSDLNCSSISADKPIEKLEIKKELLEESQNHDPQDSEIAVSIKIEPDTCESNENSSVLKNLNVTLSDAHLTQYSIDKLQVILLNPEVTQYICRVNDCTFSTQYVCMFHEHLEAVHEKDIWDGFCKECKNIVSTDDRTYSYAFYHLARIHMKHVESITDESNSFKKTSEALAIDEMCAISSDNFINKSSQASGIDNLPIITSVVSLNVANNSTNKFDQLLDDNPNIIARNKTFFENLIMQLKVNKSKNITDLAKSEKNSGIFICGDKNCHISTNSTIEFIKHYKQHVIETKKKNLPSNKWRECVYCEKIPSPDILLWQHIIDEHGNSKYKCNECAFRSVSFITTFTHSFIHHTHVNNLERVVEVEPHPASNILTSISGIQSKEKSFSPCICTLPAEASEVNPNMRLKNQTWKQCMMKFNSKSMFLQHVIYKHRNSRLKCYYCDSEEMTAPLLVIHMQKCHKFFEYKCGFCPNGGEMLFSILTHLVLQHPNKIPIMYSCVIKDEEEECNSVNLDEDPYTYIEETFGIRMKNYENYINDQKKISNKPDDSINNTACDELNESFDSNNHQNHIINLDSDDDMITDDIILDESILNSKKKIKKNQPKNNSVIENTLLKCSTDKCTFSSEDNDIFSQHIAKCVSHEIPTKYECIHCKKGFDMHDDLAIHLVTHADSEFKCGVCFLKFKVEMEFLNHKKTHKEALFVESTEPVKCDSKINNRATKTHNKGKTKNQKSNFKESNTADLSNEKASNTIPNTNDNTYGPDDIRNLPLIPILSYNINCSVCSFNTKVTSNMLRHLQLHTSEVTVPNAAPVNPVPHLQTNEMHFDKMTNLALSSHIDQPRSSINAKYNKYSDKPIPQYVPHKERFVCGSKNCSYISIDENMLKNHWETLHQDEKVYHCVHCKIDISIFPQNSKFSAPIFTHLRLHDNVLYRCTVCNYVHDLINIIRKHCVKYHGKACDVLVRGETGIADKINWVCGICKSIYNKKRILVEHCVKVHKKSNPYKCSDCDFSDTVSALVKKHIEREHIGSNAEIIKLFGRVKNKLDSAITKPTEDHNSDFENNDGKSLDEITTPIWWGRRKRASRFIEDESPSTSKRAKSEKDEFTENIDNTTKSICDNLNSDSSGNLKNSVNDVEIEQKSSEKYFCPFCDEFSSYSISAMRSHLCEELNYKRWSCRICGYHAFDIDKITKHTKEEHKVLNDAVELPPNIDKENRIDSIISNFKNVKAPKNDLLVEFLEPKPSSSHKVVEEKSQENLSSDEEGRLMICEDDENNENSFHESNKTHVCIKCKLHLSKDSLESHVLKCHPGSVYKLILEKDCVVFKCSICFQLSSDQFSLMRHFISFHPDEEVKYELQSLGNLKEEDKKSNKSVSKKLETRGRKRGTGKKAVNPSEGNPEKKKKKNEPKDPLSIVECNFQCQYCILSFNKYCGLRRHHFYKHKNEVIRINPLSKKLIHETGELKKAYNPNREPRFTCIVSSCNESFLVFEDLEIHVRDHYNIPQEYQCLECFTMCDTSISFVDHCKTTHENFNVITNSDIAIIDRIYQIDTFLVDAFKTSPTCQQAVSVTSKRVARKSTAQVDPSFYGSQMQLE